MISRRVDYPPLPGPQHEGPKGHQHFLSLLCWFGGGMLLSTSPHLACVRSACCFATAQVFQTVWGLNSEKGCERVPSVSQGSWFHFGQNGSGLVRIQACRFLDLPTANAPKSSLGPDFRVDRTTTWLRHASKSRV